MSHSVIWPRHGEYMRRVERAVMSDQLVRSAASLRISLLRIACYNASGTVMLSKDILCGELGDQACLILIAAHTCRMISNS